MPSTVRYTHFVRGGSDGTAEPAVLVANSFSLVTFQDSTISNGLKL